MKKILLLTTLLIGGGLFAQPNHDAWSALLKKHVSSSGKVNYKGFKQDKEKLNAYLTDLKEHTPTSSWSAKDKKAYWINAYNAFTIKLVSDKYPIGSIRDLSFNGKSAWDHQWIEIGGKKLSLNDIENTKLRKGFHDPRIHFVINCASFSCPILPNKAITSSNIDQMLNQYTKKFLSDTKRNKVAADEVQVSELFKWYSEDFGDLIKFINKYSSTKVNSNAKISYMTYKWNIND
ncbi:MAG: DUF547 domain-containing protein [Bacteroidetes bacterium]|nr:MAG: DUF547 domain-containing protein [Bacteroidota bacterium]